LKDDVDVSQLGSKAVLVRKAVGCNTPVYVDHPKEEVLQNMNRYITAAPYSDQQNIRKNSLLPLSWPLQSNLYWMLVVKKIKVVASSVMEAESHELINS
jgi:hypothetical protein